MSCPRCGAEEIDRYEELLCRVIMCECRSVLAIANASGVETWNHSIDCFTRQRDQLEAKCERYREQIEKGNAELRRYVEGNGFAWQDDESAVWNATTAIGLLGGTVNNLQHRCKLDQKLISDIACSGVEFDDVRLGYVSIQIDRETWDEIQALRRSEG